MTDEHQDGELEVDPTETQLQEVSEGLKGKLVRMSRELTKHNPRVQHIALRMGWKSETLVDRVKSDLPSIVEQNVYLRIAKSVILRPDSMKKILRRYLGQYELRAQDLIDRPIGNNLVTNKFSETIEYIETVLALLSKTGHNLGYPMSIADACDMVALYGDHSESVLDSIASQIELVRTKLRLGRLPERIVFFIAVKLVIKHALERGMVAVPNVIDLFDEIEYSSEEILKLLNQEDDDD